MKQSSSEDDRASVSGALAALRRARRVAEETARRTGTALVDFIDGKMVRHFPAVDAAEDARDDRDGSDP